MAVGKVNVSSQVTSVNNKTGDINLKTKDIEVEGDKNYVTSSEKELWNKILTILASGFIPEQASAALGSKTNKFKNIFGENIICSNLDVGDVKCFLNAVQEACFSTRNGKDILISAKPSDSDEEIVMMTIKGDGSKIGVHKPLELSDDATSDKYGFGIENGLLYIEEVI